MKLYLLALLSSVALAGGVGAQAPASCGGSCETGACCGQSSCCTKKVCVAEPDKKKIEKVCYSCKCVDFCLPKCPGFGHSCKDCNGCEHVDCPACGRVHTKRVLVKHVNVTECDTFKCTPTEVPACETTCAPACTTCPAGGCASGACGGVTYMPGTPVMGTAASPVITYPGKAAMPVGKP